MNKVENILFIKLWFLSFKISSLSLYVLSKVMRGNKKKQGYIFIISDEASFASHRTREQDSLFSAIVHLPFLQFSITFLVYF